MNAVRRRSSIVLVAAALVGLALTGCGSNNNNNKASGGGGGSKGGATKVAFLMPDNASPRYEKYDGPLFKAKMKSLCPKCTVLYQNADSDASKQQQQLNSVLAQGAKVVVLDPVDSTAAATMVQTAHSQGAKVISYDRPIPKLPTDFYVSYDNVRIGELITQSLVDHLKQSGAKGGVLQVNGSPTDAAAGLIKKGIHNVLDKSGFKILSEFDTPNWDPAKAQAWVSGQISRFGKQIAGVVCANDGTASGAVAAFKAAGQSPPPISGNDATVQAVQYILGGLQYNTIEKPYKTVADASAETANALLQGKKPQQTTTLFNTPSHLFIPKVVTAQTVKADVIDPGYLKAGDICTGDYTAYCRKYGIQ